MLPTSQCDDAGEVTKLEVTKNLAKKIVASGLQNDAFLLANEDQLMKNCGQLAKYFSEIQPYFDVSCNTCPWLLSILQDLNFKFSCQSRPEFQHVLALDIHPTDIYFSNTTKVSSHMKAAMARSVDLMIFNSLHELNKIQKSAPKARLILSSESSGNVEKAEGWQDLLLAARDFGLQVVGVALTRNNNNQADQFCKLIAWTRMVIAIGRSMGHDMSIVDIGPLDHPGADPEQIQTIIKQNLNDLDVHLQGHVGTAFIENVFSCIVKVIGKRAGQDRSTLIINDGIFNSFGRLLIDHQFIPDSITSLSSSNRQAMCKEEVKIDIFGSSGDDMDIIVQEQILNFNVEEEDWLLFSNMGAFSYTLDADMASVALPSKYGKFRIFTPNDADIGPENDILEENNIIAEKSCKFFMDELNTDIIEVIFLDVNNNNNENEKADEQCILELFEELPLPVVFGEGDEDDEEGLLWADYLTNIH